MKNASPESANELENCIIKITKAVIADPNKYMTLDFVIYLVRNLLESGNSGEVEKLLLDTRISV